MSKHIIRSDKIFKVLVVYDEQPPALVQMDAIRHEGKLWLVPAWLEHPTVEYQIPARIIAPDPLRYQEAEGSQVVDFSLAGQLPRAVAEGRDPSPVKYGLVVREEPDLRYPVPSIH